MAARYRIPPFNALAGRSPICWAVLVQIEHCAIVYSGRRKDKKAPRRNACNHFFIASLFTAKIRLRQQREKEILHADFIGLWGPVNQTVSKKYFDVAKKRRGGSETFLPCNSPSVGAVCPARLAKRTKRKRDLARGFYQP